MNVHDAVRDRVQDWVENALDPQRCAAAIEAVLDLHAWRFVGTPVSGWIGCTECGTERDENTCATVAAIATAMGIEVTA